MNEIIATENYFNMALDELLVINKESEWTREECKIQDDGLEIIYFDNEQELEDEKDELNEYMTLYNYEVKAKLLTINKRIALVLI